MSNVNNVKASSLLRSSMANGGGGGYASDDNNPTDASSTAKTVPFAVISCSSQDEDFPASELNKGVLGRGWQSSRFCFFPQEIVLELQQPSRIINMQLLCHEFKIPSKVEVFVSMMNPYVHSDQAIAQMKRLGYLSLDPNDRSGHQARELKSIYVNSSAAAIRLLLHNCYTNKLNIYNQVGLMAIIITGDPLEEQQMEYFNRHDVTTPSHVSMIQVACTKGMDTRTQAPSPKAVDFDFSEVDTATGTRLRQLFQDKIMAVGNEDYDEAKRLKILIERLKELGKKMKQLERRKFAAVEVEDYDTAKLCKIEMERLQHHDDVSLEQGQIDKPKPSERLELGAAAKTPDTLQGRSSCEDVMNTTFSAMVIRKEIWTQTIEDTNHAVQLLKRPDDSSSNTLTSCNGILDFEPAYSSFKIRQGDFQGVKIPTVLVSSEKQPAFVPEALPWYREHSVLKTSEISPPPTVGQQGTSTAIATRVLPPPPPPQLETPPQNLTRVPRIPPTNTTLRNETSDTPSSSGGSPEKRQGASPVKQNQTISPRTSTNFQTDPNPKPKILYHENPTLTSSTFTELSTTPDLTPLKLHPVVMSPKPVAREHTNTTTTTTTTTGTQYQIEKQQSMFLPSPLHEPEEVCIFSPTGTPRRIDELAAHSEAYFSSTPEARQYEASSTRAQEQALPFHKGDFQSPFPSGDELVPEPLADSVKMEAGPLLSMIELHHVECLYSKHWQLREKALQFLIDKLDAHELVDEPLPSFRMINKVLLRTLNDRVANVFNISLQLLRTMVATYAAIVPHRDLLVSSSGFMAILLEKLGDLNARTKEGGFETLMFLASKKEIGIHVLSGPLLKPPKNQGIWRPVLGRLQLLLHAVPQYGIQPPSRIGFPSDALMSFVTQAFNSPNGEVRNAAIKVTTEAYRLMGPPIDKYLKGIKPLIKEILTSNFERVTYESEQGDENPYLERPFSTDEQGRCGPRAGHQTIGLRPLVQHDPEFGDDNNNKGQDPGVSFSKTDTSSSNRSSLSGQDQKAEGEFETPTIVDVESPTKVSSPCYNQPPTTTIINSATAKVPETSWVHSQRSDSPVEETGDDVVEPPEAEAEPACESLRSHHCSEGEASPDTSAHAPQKAEDESLMEKDENVDSCLFCGKQDARFKEGDNLDLHFCEQCPMLASCSNCGQIVEISSLKDHYLFECASGKRYIECKKCNLAVAESRLAAHQKSKDCKMCKPHKLLRCPLCFRTVEPSDQGWRDHILQHPGCLRNPRTLIHDVPLPPKPVDAFSTPIQGKWNWNLWRS